jgi:glycerol-3-phosphate dehydrogenase
VDEPAVAVGPPPWRAEALERLATRHFDLLVVGGGIVGAGLAAEATRAGLDVALVDRGDFGGATTSASSKLIHGGLRYLRLGDVRLVREAHQERRALLRVVAPHLVRRIPFLLPLYRDGPYGRHAVRAGLWLYSLLAGERRGRLVTPERARAAVPPLRLDGLSGCGIYSDAWTNDSRLCLANVRAAADGGATVLNHAEVVALVVAGGRAAGAEVRDRIAGESVRVRARAVVNAGGPWIDRIRRLEDPRARPTSRLSKGVHVLLAREEPWSAALTVPHDRVRVSFAVPWEGMLLLGTTDTLYEGDPADVAASETDVERVLAEASLALEVDRGAVLSTFAGLRVLPGARGGSTATVRRETLFLRGPAGMLSIAGGKLTTYRRIALHALRDLRPDLGLHRVAADPLPLPGATELRVAADAVASAHPELDPQVRLHLAHLYGSLAAEVLAGAEDDPSLLERLNPGAPDVVAQAVYARAREWACTDEDVYRRRTTLALRGLAPAGEPAARLPT